LSGLARQKDQHMETFKNLTEILNNLTVTVAAVIGGLWAVDRIKKERTDEAALEMAVSVRSTPVENAHLAVFTVRLTNTGRTKIEAKSRRDGEFTFSEDGEQSEKLRYACSLQVRKLDATAIHGAQRLNWFGGGPWRDVLLSPEGPEINVLLEYENPERNNVVEFWMEPGETYRLGVPVILERGAYLGKLTFVAAPQERGWLDGALDEMGFRRPPSGIRDENFWSQIFAFAVPTAAEADGETA
jgi:hypothetical protein